MKTKKRKLIIEVQATPTLCSRCCYIWWTGTTNAKCNLFEERLLAEGKKRLFRLAQCLAADAGEVEVEP